MNDVTQITIQNVTLANIGSDPNTYPEEVVCAAMDTIIEMERVLRLYKQNMTANILKRMAHDNATKIQFISTTGAERTATMKPGTKKLNPAIKDPEEFIKQAGFPAEQFGEYKFVPAGWSVFKEKRKLGGDVQLMCDELYVEGTPGIEIK